MLRTTSVVLAATIVLAACSKDKNAEGMDSAAMANMPGMANPGDTARPASVEKEGAGPPTSLDVNRAQITHAKIEWAAPVVGSAGMTAAIPGQITTDEDRTVRIGAPARGRIMTVRVNPGDRVRTGQTLIEIQSPEAGAAQSDVAKATAMLNSRRAQAQYAKSARDRAERLLGLKAIPRQEYDRAVADDELAQAELHEAEAELSRARTVAEQIGADVRANGLIQIRAPYDGVVLTRSAVPGTFIEAGSPLMVVTDPTRLWLVLSAPEQHSGLFRQGAALSFTVPAFPDTFSARITSLGAGLDPDTRALPVRASLDSHGNRLKPGMLATAIVTGASRGTALLVADIAVQSLDGKPTVFVVTPDGGGGAKIERREVEVGARAGGRVAILRGLRATDQVVTKGAFLVKSAFLKGSMPDMEM